MKLIIGGKGAGKTSELIQKSNAEGLYIVCPTREDAMWIKRMADELFLPILFPVTFQEFMRYSHASVLRKGVLIDDLDRCIQKLFSTPILMSTLTNPDVLEVKG